MEKKFNLLELTVEQFLDFADQYESVRQKVFSVLSQKKLRAHPTDNKQQINLINEDEVGTVPWRISGSGFLIDSKNRVIGDLRECPEEWRYKIAQLPTLLEEIKLFQLENSAYFNALVKEGYQFDGYGRFWKEEK